MVRKVVTSGNNHSDIKHVREPGETAPICKITVRNTRGNGRWLPKDEAAIPNHKWCSYCTARIEAGDAPSETAPKCGRCGHVSVTDVVSVGGDRFTLCEECELAVTHDQNVRNAEVRS